jgi:hypothetical protein
MTVKADRVAGEVVEEDGFAPDWVDPKLLERIPKNAHPAIVDMMRALIPVAIEMDPEDAQMDIMNRILTADGPEAIAAMANNMAAEDMLQKPFTITEVTWYRTDKYKDGLPVYATIFGMAEDGPVRVTCGGTNVMAILYKAVNDGWLPARFKFQQSAKETSNGYRPLWLVPAPA